MVNNVNWYKIYDFWERERESEHYTTRFSFSVSFCIVFKTSSGIRTGNNEHVNFRTTSRDNNNTYVLLLLSLSFEWLKVNILIIKEQ